MEFRHYFLRRSGMTAVCLLLIVYAQTAMAQGVTISNVNPASASAGDTKTVTITLSGSPLPPDVKSATIGTIYGSSLSYTSPDVTATFAIPSTETTGFKDVGIVFPTPNGDVTVTETDGFTVLSSAGVFSPVYVNAASAAENPDGASWSSAFTSLQDGIDAAALYAASAGSEGQVWVAQGSYTPTSGTNRTASFELKSGVAVYGGFNGSETVLTGRNHTTNITTLSGDIGTPGTKTDNSYHVVIGADGAVLDGFTVSGGYANGEKSNRLGGGMLNIGTYSTTGSPIVPAIRNCRFTDNYAESGGAMYNYFSSAIIEGNTFSGNTAQYGGALLFRVGSDAAVSNCTFSTNSADWRGGAVYIDYGADPTLSGCTFTGNTTNGNGGAVYVDDRASQLGGTYPTVTGCTFESNTAAYRGGAFAAYNSSCYPAISSCTFTSNTATQGGGAIALDQGVVLTLSGATYSGNTGGTGNANLDYDSTCTVQ